MACVLWQAAAAGITGLSRAVITLVVELFWLALTQQGAPWDCRSTCNQSGLVGALVRVVKPG